MGTYEFEVPLISSVASFVEMFHWLRLQKRLETHWPPRYSDIFKKLEQIGLKDVERRFIAKYCDVGVATWQEYFDVPYLNADEAASMYALWECEDEFRKREFPPTWVVDDSSDWPPMPVRSPFELALHLREEAQIIAGFAPDSQCWRARALQLIENAMNAASLVWGFTDLPEGPSSDTLMGHVSLIRRIAEIMDRRRASVSSKPSHRKKSRSEPKVRRRPTDEQFRLYQYLMNTGQTQTKVAEVLGEKYRQPMYQGKISRAKTAVEAWLGGNPWPELCLPNRATAMDPKRIDLGPRSGDLPHCGIEEE